MSSSEEYVMASDGRNATYSVQCTCICTTFDYLECSDHQVSLYANVEFSSAYVIINLQTWVLLFDYLGVGIPTPPPSEPATPTGSEKSGEGAEPYTSWSTTPGYSKVDVAATPTATPLRDPRRDTDNSFPLHMSVKIDQSLQQDAIDYLELVQDAALDGEEDAGVGEGVAKKPAPLDNGLVSEESTLKSQGEVWGVEGKTNAKVVLRVRFLSVTFNKPEHPLARGSVSLFNAAVRMERGNMEVEGSLGQASLLDLTETGAYYRERWVGLRWMVGGAYVGGRWGLGKCG